MNKECQNIEVERMRIESDNATEALEFERGRLWTTLFFAFVVVAIIGMTFLGVTKLKANAGAYDRCAEVE